MSLKSGVVVLAVAVVVVTGCSSSKPSATAPAGSSTTAPAKLAGSYTRPDCTPKPSTAVGATRVPGSSSDVDIVSFDGTKIRGHWFPRSAVGDAKAPTVLKGPGWVSPVTSTRSRTATACSATSTSTRSNAAGYNVLTWDPRGFGSSGGTVETDSADSKAATSSGSSTGSRSSRACSSTGRATRAWEWSARRTAAASNSPPRPSTAASTRSVPQLAWHSLGPSLYAAQTVKSGWGNLLYRAAGGHKVDPHVTSVYNAGNTTGTLTPADVQWFLDRGPGDLVRDISVPTLFEQGTIDTLFALDEAVTNFEILQARHVPTAMIWMCSGHGVCLTNPGDQKLPGQAALAWLDRYVKNDANAQTGPQFQYVDQNGTQYTADAFPLPAAAPITATGTGSLTLAAGGGSGPAHATGNPGPVGTISLGDHSGQSNARARHPDHGHGRGERAGSAEADTAVFGIVTRGRPPHARLRATRRRRDRHRAREPDHADRRSRSTVRITR